MTKEEIARVAHEVNRAYCEALGDDSQKLGPVKNPDAREHPCLVPFDALPLEQKVKDYLFRSVVSALAGH